MSHAPPSLSQGIPAGACSVYLPLLEASFGFPDSLQLLYVCNSSSPRNSTAAACNTSPAILALPHSATSSPGPDPPDSANVRYGIAVAAAIIIVVILAIIAGRHLYIRHALRNKPASGRQMERDVGMGSFAIRPPPPRAAPDAFWGAGPAAGPDSPVAGYAQPGPFLVGEDDLPPHVVAASRAAEERVRQGILQNQAARSAQALGDASWSTRV